MKKAEMTSTGTIGAIIVVLVLVFFFLFATNKSFGQFFQGTKAVSDSFLKQNLEKCLEQPGNDHDKDGLKDFCDNCPLIPNTPDNPWPKLCCGNDGKGNFLKDPKLGYKDDNFKATGWCGDKAMSDDLTKPKPYYSPAWS